MTPRLAAVRVLAQVLGQGRSLAAALPPVLAQLPMPAERALAQALAYGVLRWQPRLQALTERLLKRPLKARDADVQAVLLCGLYELIHQGTPAHAAVAENVELARALRKGWAAGLINAVLRAYLRQAESLAQAVDRDPAVRLAHPRWLLEQLQRDWPQDWEAIAAANNAHPPMTLRVNARQATREAYLAELAAAGLAARPAPHTTHGLILERPCPVEQLPGFAAGRVSVQDGAAQQAAGLLDPQPGERVLDAAAAPGGKSAHLLECQPQLSELVALDVDAERLSPMRAGLARLGLSATLVAGDAGDPAAWWDGRPFDAVLLDAPCSATGVIRRHPDIKVLRRPGDVASLARTQARLLEALWGVLQPGGRLLYATCSVLAAENRERIAAFLQHRADAELLPLVAQWGRDTGAGRQILPGEDQMDGFFYASLRKRA